MLATIPIYIRRKIKKENIWKTLEYSPVLGWVKAVPKSSILIIFPPATHNGRDIAGPKLHDTRVIVM